MIEELFYRLPLSKNNKCPVCCRINSNQTRIIAVSVYSRDHRKMFIHHCESFICQKCNTMFINTEIVKRVQEETGLLLDVVFGLRKTTPEGVRKMSLSPRNPRHALHGKYNHNEFEIVLSDPNTFKIRSRIVSYKAEMDVCRRCSSKLVKDYSYIQVSEKAFVRINGLYCYHCGILYTRRADHVEYLLKDNPFARSQSFNGKKIWNITAETEKQEKMVREQKIEQEIVRQKRKDLSGVRSAVLMICVEYKDNTQNDYIIVNNKNVAAGIHYSSGVGRELLSAAFSPERKNRGVLYNREYRVIRTVFLDDKQSFVEKYITTDLYIKKDGGYRSSVLNSNFEIVDTLLYSYKTKMYEIIHSTYDKELESCFVDIRIFRQYVSEYGKPCVDLSFDYNNRINDGANHSENWNNLNEESILKGYGYNVSRAEDLSDRQREEILAEIVDLEILTVSRIVGFLSFFIQTHPQEMYFEARNKWNSDRDFIQNYCINSQRFLIAQ